MWFSCFNDWNFINDSYNGESLKENIRLIGACIPYRKKNNKIKCGLSYDNELIYLVNILPQSLMYYVFNFGSIEREDENKYISSIISNLFTIEEEMKYKKKLKRLCHK